jgi:hypothetical protein
MAQLDEDNTPKVEEVNSVREHFLFDFSRFLLH